MVSAETTDDSILFPFAFDIKSKDNSKNMLKVELDKKSPSSVYYCNLRSVYEDNYPAKFNEELAHMLIQQYTEAGDLVMDPMAGSGVISLVAYSLGRKIWYQDINEKAKDLFVEKFEKLRPQQFNDCEFIHVADSCCKIAAEPNSVDLILTSPPFGLSIDAAHESYSDNPDDLGNSPSYEIWRIKMKKIMANCFQVLKPGKLMIIETRPRSMKRVSYPLNVWVTIDGMEHVGFEFFTEFIELVPPYRIWTYGDFDQRKPIPMHCNLTILRKPINEKIARW